MNSGEHVKRESGFTLVEVMITMVIALVILGGLLLSFMGQYGEYKYQNKRTDAVQDLEFALRFVADDLRTGMWSSSGDANATVAFTAVSGTLPPGVTADATGTFTLWAWDAGATGVNGDSARAQRKFVFDFDTETLRYDRIIATIVDGAYSALADGPDTVLENVTFFKVFEDGVTSRVGYADIPAALGPLNLGLLNEEGSEVASHNGTSIGEVSVRRSDTGGANVPAYTVLIEVAVDAGYNKGSFINVKGVDVKTFENPARKRIWRYIQVHPRVVMP